MIPRFEQETNHLKSRICQFECPTWSSWHELTTCENSHHCGLSKRTDKRSCLVPSLKHLIRSNHKEDIPIFRKLSYFAKTSLLEFNR